MCNISVISKCTLNEPCKHKLKFVLFGNHNLDLKTCRCYKLQVNITKASNDSLSVVIHFYN